MAHNTTINAGSGGDAIVDYDLAAGGAYPTTGKVPAGVVFVSATSSTTPTPVTAANGLYVQPGTSTAWNVVPASPTASAYLPVRITDGSAYVGSGTEYTDGDTDTTPNGTCVFWADTSNVMRAVSAAHPLPISDAGGSLTVDGTVAISGSVAVTGTFWQATQPVSGTVTANAGTGTFAVSAASLPLPSGASTAAKQPALGTAGTASADVLSVQGVASMTALKVDGSAVTQPVSGTFWQATQPVSLASLPALATGSNVVGAVTQSGTWNVGTVTTLTTCSTVTNLAQLGGQAVAMGTGVRSAGTQRVTIATDDVVPASQSGTWTVQPGNTPNTSPWLVTDTPATSGGLSFTHVTAAATNNKTQIKATAGQLFAIHAINLTATTKYIKVFNNTSAGVTAGTTAADYQFPIPANGTTGAGFVLELNKGVAHSTGITIMITGAVSLTDNTSLAANDVVATFFWK